MELDDVIPSLIASPVRRIIHVWMLEFDRVHAMERLVAFKIQPVTCAMWRHICEDIQSNVPIYVFDILTYMGTHIRWPLGLRDCDPQKVRTGMRIPESHIAAWRRRAITIPLLPLHSLHPHIFSDSFVYL